VNIKEGHADGGGDGVLGVLGGFVAVDAGEAAGDTASKSEGFEDAGAEIGEFFQRAVADCLGRWDWECGSGRGARFERFSIAGVWRGGER
jgi:hypothetical protein